MAQQILTNTQIIVGSFDISSFADKIDVSETASTVESRQRLAPEVSESSPIRSPITLSGSKASRTSQRQELLLLSQPQRLGHSTATW